MKETDLLRAAETPSDVGLELGPIDLNRAPALPPGEEPSLAAESVTTPNLWGWAFDDSTPIDPWQYDIFITRSARLYVVLSNLMLPDGSLVGPDVGEGAIIVGEHGTTEQWVNERMKESQCRRVAIETWRWLGPQYSAPGDLIVRPAYGRLFLFGTGARQSIENPHGFPVGTAADIRRGEMIYVAEFICRGRLEAGRELGPCPPSVLKQTQTRRPNVRLSI
jgi:hypothetical protein